MLVAAAATTATQAALVQITFTNNFVKNTAAGGATNLLLDLTGDGINDVRGAVQPQLAGINSVYSSNLRAVAHFVPASYSNRVRVGQNATNQSGYSNLTLNGLTPFFFQDASINGGAKTEGFAEFTSTSVGSEYTVTLHRLIFDDSNPIAATPDIGTTYPTFGAAIPEPSSLGLLALGAGGLLARRRRVQAAA